MGGQTDTHLWHLYWIKFPTLNPGGLASSVPFFVLPRINLEAKTSTGLHGPNKIPLYKGLIQSGLRIPKFPSVHSLSSFSLPLQLPSPLLFLSTLSLTPPHVKLVGRRKRVTTNLMCYLFTGLFCFMYLI